MPELVTAAIKDQLAADIQRICRERDATLELTVRYLLGLGLQAHDAKQGKTGPMTWGES